MHILYLIAKLSFQYMCLFELGVQIILQNDWLAGSSKYKDSDPHNQILRKDCLTGTHFKQHSNGKGDTLGLT